MRSIVLIMGLALPALTTAFYVTCYSGSGCTGAQGAVRSHNDVICVDVVGRKSCHVWGHRSAGGGAGFIRYTGCQNCKTGDNCWAGSCQIKGVYNNRVCFSLEDGWRDARFLNCPICSCPLKRDTETEGLAELEGRNVTEVS
ncbi:hypothetical protein QBC34DRAFT_384343 [Podospora aff. communis PSN243]|uniref:Cyanovirin-N domain-containing protein n=1 Tax=Podospora aff. communis PSN243 TaxID=3040156 RepID=A0AAV9GD78_9PEZI|nr:hypothetical protein QBC34DRAFT_384343 [Podospora aff. communis PSN243]